MRLPVAALAATGVLLVGAVVVMRELSAPGGVPELAERARYLTSPAAPPPPSGLRASALAPSSARVSWDAPTERVAAGYEVRWGDLVRHVPGPEVELTGLAPDARTRVEVRAVGARGARSAAAEVAVTPGADAASPVNLPGAPLRAFDGPESVRPDLWRVLRDPVPQHTGECVRGGPGRLLPACRTADLQSNTPLVLRERPEDGLRGRVVPEAAGPVGDSALPLALVPDRRRDLGALDVERWPSGSVVMTVRDGGAVLRAASGEQTVSERTAPLSAGVRHRWEVLVRESSVVALRDGEVVAELGGITLSSRFWPRLVLREDARVELTAFGSAGAPAELSPERVVPLRLDGVDATTGVTRLSTDADRVGGLQDHRAPGGDRRGGRGARPGLLVASPPRDAPGADAVRPRRRPGAPGGVAAGPAGARAAAAAGAAGGPGRRAARGGAAGRLGRRGARVRGVRGGARRAPGAGRGGAGAAGPRDHGAGDRSHPVAAAPLGLDRATGE
ncbi:fibronectin type III domain-containing protein [Actinosynnema pretiosum subsp. pretiosum]|uniref:Fibronectin type III domain-containing protein n=1 Tax=Actinosynnema pretiosum subsp. pretiosum TaxID=103721 RepID=A0AA45L1L2_9PSEU|nr:C-terminal domain of CinA type S [Actinosynnema pretiosum subsp. pretiosum]QUF01754.1 fibronectin type III domain-containing protein [Actinosynnema pretiosum subsp. pretiosum]